MTKGVFGTDGIRGRVGVYPITPEFCLRLGWSIGKVFADQCPDSDPQTSSDGAVKPTVLIGKDTRISGYMFEAALQAGLVSAGADVKLLGPMPTPGIAYLTRTLKGAAGIVISASHNPFGDNGIKFFDASGSKLSDDLEAQIEAALRQAMDCEPSEALGRASRVPDAVGRYVEFCKSSVSQSLDLSGMKLVIDCANGATYQIADKVFAEMGARVETIAASPNGFNINKECGSTHPETLMARVVESGADVGIAFDGDGDRVVMVDRKGRLVDGDQIVYAIAKHRQRQGTLTGGVVGTLMSNLGLQLALQQDTIEFARANVGDRYILEMLKAKNWQLGAEPSGHILTLDLTSTGDAIISALQVLLAMQSAQTDLDELVAGVTKMPQTLVNVVTSNPKEVMQHPAVAQIVAAFAAELGDRGRILVRPSGTEPLLRIMVEGADESEICGVAEQIAVVAKQAAGDS